jgi:HAD superfamily hydrolase (TIGR01509 family)
MNGVKNIFFDVGNTLLFPRLERMLEPLRARTVFTRAAAQWRETEKQTKVRFDAAQAGEGRVDQGFWQIFYSRLLAELGILDDSLKSQLVNTIRISANWNEIRPGTRESLERIGKRYRLGVISNADGKISEVLSQCGIADCFLTITDSGLIGYEKPHPAIFEKALEEMQADASESLYVGDIYSVDYIGATSAGMRAILFDACGAYEGKGLPRVESLEQLEIDLKKV